MTSLLGSDLGGLVQEKTVLDTDSEIDGAMNPRGHAWLLGLLALLSSACYWILIAMALNPRLKLVYDVKGAKYGGPLTWPSRWMHLASLSGASRTALYVCLMVALSLLWLCAIYLVRRDDRRILTFIIAAAFGLFAMLFVFCPAFGSRDVFSYAFYGRSMAVYHANPFLLIPSARPHDILFPYIGWKYNASVYGPVFNYLSFAISKVAGNNIVANVLGFKLLAGVSYAACLPFVYLLARKVSPGRENMALVISAWCPILVLHILGGGHNETVMIALILAGYFLYRKGYLLTGIAIVLVAAMVKITAALALAPMLVLYIREWRGAPSKRLAAAGALVIAIPLISYLPFLQNLRIFETTIHMSKLYSASSVPRLASYEYQKLLTHGGSVTARTLQIANGRVRLLFLGLFVVVAILLLLRVRDYRSMVVCSASLFLVWFLTSSYVLPWYLAMGIMLAAIGGWNVTTAAMIGASVAFSMYHLPEAVRGSIGGPSIQVGVAFLLLLAVWLALSFAFVRRRASGPMDVTTGADADQ